MERDKMNLKTIIFMDILFNLFFLTYSFFLLYDSVPFETLFVKICCYTIFADFFLSCFPSKNLIKIAMSIDIVSIGIILYYIQQYTMFKIYFLFYFIFCLFKNYFRHSFWFSKKESNDLTMVLLEEDNV